MISLVLFGDQYICGVFFKAILVDICYVRSYKQFIICLFLFRAVFLDRYEGPEYKLRIPTPQAVKGSGAGFVLPSLVGILTGLLVAVYTA